MSLFYLYAWLQQYFTPDEGTLEAGREVVCKMAQRRVHDMHYLARVSCVINWYAEHRFVSLPKDKACNKHLQAWQYLQVCLHFLRFIY